MSKPLDPEQLRAVTTTGVSVVLTAGAGCGKTGTIEAKFMKLVESGQNLGRIAVLTFTEKAAAELRHRIRAACIERAAMNHIDDLGIDWSLVAFAIDGVTISTYHSFYEKLCREFAESLGLDPDFKLLDDRIASGLKQQAALEALRNRLSNADESLIEFAARHRLDGVVEQICKLLDKSEEAKIKGLAETSPESLAQKWRDAASHYREEIADELRSFLQELLSFDRTTLTDNWKSKLSQVDEMVSSPPESQQEYFQKIFKHLSGQKPKRPNFQECFQKFNAIKESEYLPFVLSDEKLLESAARETVLLALLVVDTKALYQQSKERRRVVDFDDLVERAEDLSVSGLNLGHSKATRFDVLLVDEFQDTDSKQARILKNLCGVRFDQGELFVVGDMKQSIYRFRGAKPQELQDLSKAMPLEGQQNLVRNYRSRSRVIQFVNALAAQLYPDEAPLQVGLKAETAVNDQSPAVDFLWTTILKKDEDSENKAKPDFTMPNSDIHMEAANLANFVRTMLDSGHLVGARDGKLRPVELKDFVVISRSRTHWWIFEKAFAKQGLKIFQDNVGSLFKKPEIRDLVTFFGLVENPMDDLRLAAVMRGPFCSVSDEALFWVAQSNSKLKFAECFWNLSVDNRGGISDVEWNSIVALKELLSHLAQNKAMIRPSEVVRMAINETGYDEILGNLSYEPVRAKANLEKLIEDARSYDHDPDFSFSAMMRQWLYDMANDTKVDEAVVEPPKDRIRFLTVHSSKGLQFPVVILPGLSSPPPPDKQPWSIHPEFGLVTRSRTNETDEPGDGEDHDGWLLSQLAGKVESGKELDNLLYVALTRAEDQIVLSSAFKMAKPDEPLKPGGEFLKRIAQAVDLKSGKSLRGNSAEPLARVHILQGESQ